MLTDTYKAFSSQFSFARDQSYFVKRANLPINYQPISDFSPIWNNRRRRRRRSRNLNSRGTYVKQGRSAYQLVNYHQTSLFGKIAAGAGVGIVITKVVVLRPTGQ